MPMYRKKPVVIDAVQLTTENTLAVMKFITAPAHVAENGDSIVIPTLEGDHRADPGDWVIRGIKGEFYPCKADIFAATYEEVK